MGVLGSLCQSSELVVLDARNELRVTKALEIACVAQKLSSVVEKVPQVLVRKTSVCLELLPVA